MDIEDEAYHSLPNASDEFKEGGKQMEVSAGKEGHGSRPTVGSPPKERASMNIGDKLLIGGSRSFDKTQTSAEGTIKVPCSTSNNPKSLTVSNAITPTTRLAGQLGSISFRGMESKFSAQADSPTSDYASGNFSSLAESDRGYDSLPSMTSNNPTIEKPVLITGGDYTGEEMDVDRVKVTSPPEGTNTDKIDIQDVGLLTGKVPARTLSETSSMASESSSLSPAPLSMRTPSIRSSESPASVPAIAEDIEVVTEAVPVPSPSERLRPEGVSSKRSAAGLLEGDLGPSTKNPRLSPEVLGKLLNTGT